MSLLTNHTWRHELAKYIDNACKNSSIDLTAFVFMPNHVHLLVNPKDEHPDIGVPGIVQAAVFEIHQGGVG